VVLPEYPVKGKLGRKNQSEIMSQSPGLDNLWLKRKARKIQSLLNRVDKSSRREKNCERGTKGKDIYYSESRAEVGETWGEI